jgi:hypothetical protein
MTEFNAAGGIEFRLDRKMTEKFREELALELEKVAEIGY